MKNTLKLLFGSACLLAAFNVQTAQAQVIFQDRADFESVFPTASIENWDHYRNGKVINNGATLNGITYNTNSANKALVTSNWLTTTGSKGLGETGNTYFTSADTITFTFAHPLSAFAIDINSFGTHVGDYTATINSGPTLYALNSYSNPFPGYSSGDFLGFSNPDPFTSVTINDPSGFSYTLDTLRFVNAPPAAVVPEPATIALMMVGLIGIVVFTLRRRTN